MSQFTLYGDGIHDDTDAIQELIDSGACEITLPAPKKRYLISRTLTLPSNFKLKLPRYAVIRLMDGSDCPMVSNKLIRDYAERIPEDKKTVFDGVSYHLWYHVNEFSDEIMSENIELTGGIWDFNNMNQTPNPEQTKKLDQYGYTGDGMLFYGVKGLKVSDMTFKDPVHYGATFDRVSYFTVENIKFDYNYGNPWAVNMDGVHFNGNCHYGLIRNLSGACYDDVVALNAYEGSGGDITNITIDGIYSENSHSAVRLLLVKEKMENIHITNIYGTYYQYAVGLTKYYPGENTGFYDGIHIDHVYASKAERLSVYMKDGSFVFPLIYTNDDVVIKNLSVSELRRIEENTPVETVHVGRRVKVDRLIINDLVQENHVEGSDMPMLLNLGSIDKLLIANVSLGGQSEIVNKGVIGTVTKN